MRTYRHGRDTLLRVRRHMVRRIENTGGTQFIASASPCRQGSQQVATLPRTNPGRAGAQPSRRRDVDGGVHHRVGVVVNDDAVQTSTSFSAVGRDGGRHKAECVRAAGRSSAPPGRDQAAKAVFRRSRMARLRRMRGTAYAARSHGSAVPPAVPAQPRHAPVPTVAPEAGHTDAGRAGMRSGRARSQSSDWRAAHTRSRTALPARAHGWGDGGHTRRRKERSGGGAPTRAAPQRHAPRAARVLRAPGRQVARERR